MTGGESRHTDGLGRWRRPPTSTRPVSVGSNCFKVSLPVHGGTLLLYTPTEDSEEYRRGKQAFTNRKKPTGSRKNTNTCISLPATPLSPTSSHSHGGVSLSNTDEQSWSCASGSERLGHVTLPGVKGRADKRAKDPSDGCCSYITETHLCLSPLVAWSWQL